MIWLLIHLCCHTDVPTIVLVYRMCNKWIVNSQTSNLESPRIGMLQVTFRTITNKHIGFLMIVFWNNMTRWSKELCCSTGWYLLISSIEIYKVQIPLLLLSNYTHAHTYTQKNSTTISLAIKEWIMINLFFNIYIYIYINDQWSNDEFSR